MDKGRACADDLRLRGILLGSVATAFLLCVSAGAADAPSTEQATPAAAAPSAPVPAAKTAAPVRRFEIAEFDVDGNTVLDARAIESAVYPFLGPDKTMADIESARAALEKAYATAGFQTVYVTIPPQTVRSGIVQLKAMETKIGSIAISGTRYSKENQVKAALPSLAPGTVPNVQSLNKELASLNSKSADRQVTPSMKQGTAPQTIDVDLAVQDKLALHGGVELNNRYSRDTHQLRLQANVSYDDLWHLGHSLSAMYSVAPQDPADGEVYVLTYTAPVPGTDVKLSLSGLHSNSNVTTLGSTNVLGKGNSLTVSGTLPLGMVGNYFHYLQATVAYKHFTDRVSLCDTTTTTGPCSADALKVSAAPITYYPLSLSYFGSWRNAHNEVSLNGGLTFSFRGLGSDQVAFDNARYRADSNFLYARGGASYLRHLPYGFDLSLEGEAQISNGALISNEQFSLGGDGSVRGYLQSEGLGDKGIRGSLELRGPSLASHFGSQINELKLIGFFDGARAWLNNPLPQQQGVYSMRSVGVGITAQAFDYLYGSVFFADPLHQTTDSTKAGQSRVQFRVWTQF